MDSPKLLFHCLNNVATYIATNIGYFIKPGIGNSQQTWYDTTVKKMGTETYSLFGI